MPVDERLLVAGGDEHLTRSVLICSMAEAFVFSRNRPLKRCPFKAIVDIGQRRYFAGAFAFFSAVSRGISLPAASTQ